MTVFIETVRCVHKMQVKISALQILHFSSNFSQQRPLISNLCTMTIVKLCCHNFTLSAYFMIFSVSSISYRPTDLSLLKEFSKNVSFWKFYIFHQISPNRGHWLAIFTTSKIVLPQLLTKCSTGSSRLMRISLLRISLLRFFKTITKNLPNAIFMHY